MRSSDLCSRQKRGDAAHACISRPLLTRSVFINIELCSEWPPPILWARAKGAVAEPSGLVPVNLNPNQNVLRKCPGRRMTLLCECYTKRELCKVECCVFLILNDLHHTGSLTCSMSWDEPQLFHLQQGMTTPVSQSQKETDAKKKERHSPESSI